MKFTELPLKGAFKIEIEPKIDERGFFARSFCANEFKNAGIVNNFVQGNLSLNSAKGTLRGMHYQNPPHGEDKLVYCPRGSIFDVMVDIRKDSKTYLQWHGEVLSSENLNMFLIPKGFAHGYQTLENDTLVSYLVSEFYKPGGEGGIRWDDPKVGIKWPNFSSRIISEKDLKLPLL
jgi:dTDP-4-dehydrorhamnose 3,5-epimerase